MSYFVGGDLCLKLVEPKDGLPEQLLPLPAQGSA
jgi:hypothetical protein